MRRLLPVFAALLMAFQINANAQGTSLSLNTVTIDPGHGGHDPGCVSADGKTLEKDIALDIAKRFYRMLGEEYPDLKRVMTRDRDVFIPLEDRAKISNSAHSDLFISIHVNAAHSSAARGFSIHVLGESRRGNDLLGGNLELVKRENSVILLEDDYETRYEGFNPNDTESYIFFSLIQNAHLGHSLEFADEVARSMAADSPIRNNRGISQDPFWVLWRTASPAVLIEVGFMSNPSDLEKMRTESGREQIARCIFNAFKSFKKSFDKSSTVAPKEEMVQDAREVKEVPEVQEVKEMEESSVIYGTQVLATSRKLSANDRFFEGYTPLELKTATLYRYVIGTSASLEEAKRLNSVIKEKFPDSYLVKVEKGNATRVN